MLSSWRFWLLGVLLIVAVIVASSAVTLQVSGRLLTVQPTQSSMSLAVGGSGAAINPSSPQPPTLDPSNRRGVASDSADKPLRAEAGHGLGQVSGQRTQEYWNAVSTVYVLFVLQSTRYQATPNQPLSDQQRLALSDEMEGLIAKFDAIDQAGVDPDLISVSVELRKLLIFSRNAGRKPAMATRDAAGSLAAVMTLMEGVTYAAAFDKGRADLVPVLKARYGITVTHAR